MSADSGGAPSRIQVDTAAWPDRAPEAFDAFRAPCEQTRLDLWLAAGFPGYSPVNSACRFSTNACIPST